MDSQPKKSSFTKPTGLVQDKFFKRFWWIILFIILLSAAILIIFLRQEKNEIDQTNTTNGNLSTEIALIKNIGINLDYYDSTTNKAGDFVFTKIDLPQDRLWLDYGYIIPADQTADNQEAANPHPSLILPLGTKIRALIDGIIIDVPKLYSNDYSIQISADGQKNDLIFELEHVKNPVVKTGDKVSAGQIVAEVTDFSSHNYPGFGSFDLAVFHTNENGQPEHLCPFAYLDPFIKEEIEEKILDFYTKLGNLCWQFKPV